MEEVSADRVMTALINELALLPPGTRLESERALAERLGVSRTALRDRIARLESVGVLERRSGSGTYVQDVSGATVSDSLEFALLARGLDTDSMIPVRWAIEREAARRAAKRNDRPALRDMEAALDDMEYGHSVPTMNCADKEFHGALVRASGSQGLVLFWEMSWSMLAGSIREVVLADEQARMQPIHARIYDAVKAADPVDAVYAVDAHFEWLYGGISAGSKSSLSRRADAAIEQEARQPDGDDAQ